jgi:2-keto-4-pentenoate hydratase
MQKLTYRLLPIITIFYLSLNQNIIAGGENTIVEDCISEFTQAFNAGHRLSNNKNCIWKNLTLKDALLIQSGSVAALSNFGQPIGYKVTNAGPGGKVVATILEKMIVDSGSTINLSTGALLIAEADILVRVSDKRINHATTLEEVAKFIDAIIPYIESSDMMLPQGTPRVTPTWTASNGNARWGITGKLVITNGDTSIVERLANTKATLVDQDGNQFSSTRMADNPLEAVLTVINELKKREGSIGLRKGDIISLGNFGRPTRPKAGQTLTATYEGLNNDVVTVTAKYE